MVKIALLIGVSEYQSGFQPLPAATKDVEAVQRVLEHPEIGGFASTDITTLLNPDPQRMREMLVTLFRNRQKSDLLLLYFSGHGTTDDRGTFYLTCANTKPELLEATAIPANFVHDLMENNRSKQQIVVLDSCFSGAFAKGMGVKGSAVNLEAQLGGQGRAVLTSSSATEYSFEQKEADLSVYTRYWVEGLETGAADEDSDGWISADELHSYTCRKVRESAPAMQPQIYAAGEGYKIVLAKAPLGDPQLEYRKEVERLARSRKGEFSPILLNALDETRKRLPLSVETAQAIQDEVLGPYRELQAKLQQYEQAVNAALLSQDRVSQTMRDDLSYLQQALGLRDADVASINSRIPRHLRPQPRREPAHSQTDSATGRRDSRAIALWGSVIAVAVVGVVAFSSYSNRGSSPLVNPSSTASTQSKSADIFLSQGIAKYRKRDFQGAITDYTEAIRLKPDFAAAYISRGNAKYALGDKQEAMKDYTEAIQINKNWGGSNSGYYGLPTAYNNRGNAKYALGDNQGAITDYTEAIRLKLDFADAYNNRGAAKRDLGDNQGAITDYTEAIRLKPDLAVAYHNRGAAKYALGDKQEAMKDYTEAIQINKNWGGFNSEYYGLPSAYVGRGNAKYALGDQQEAMKDYTEAIRLKPDLAVAYHNRGAAKYALGDKQEAMKDYTEAIQINKNWGGFNSEYYGLPSAYVGRGNAKYALGDQQEAMRDYTEAIRLKPDYAVAYSNRGFTRQALSDKQGAIKDYQEAAKLYQQQGNTESYRKVLNQTKQLEKESK